MKKTLLLLLLCGSTQVSAFNLGDSLKQLANEVAPPEAKALVGSTPEAEEIAIGRQIAGNLLGAAPLVKDERLQQYVNQVGRWVANQSERPDLPWHFGVIESDDINAFATPGGYIFVTKGLYRKLNDEAELAGVLAHEVAHVVRKHHLKLLKKGKLLDLGSQLLGKEVGGENEKITQLIGSGAEITARSLDQKAEFEADRMAVVLSSRAGYDAYGLPTVLQEIGHSGGASSVELLFKTHPHPDERLKRLDNSMGARFDRLPGQNLSNRFYRLK